MHRISLPLLLLVATVTAQAMPSLTVGDVTYENVQVKKEYPSSLFIQHSGGTVFVDKAKLTQEQIASLLPPTADGQDKTEDSGDASPQAGIAPEEIRPGPETLASDEERAFFAACEKANTTEIKSMLAANPDLVKAAMRGRWVESQPQTAEEKAAGTKGYEVIPITVSALQTLIDKSPMTPGRLEAIKALVEAGADVKAPTSKLGYSNSRNPVSLPIRLTPEELDYLLSQGADTSFGWCIPCRPPLSGLVVEINVSKNPEKKSEMRDRLRILLKHNPDPQLVENAKRMSEDGAYWKSLGVESWQQDKELTAILAGN
jgi:hypothetical protein